MPYHHPWSSLATALERVFGRFAFPSPVRTLAIFQILVFVLAQFSPGYVEWLTLDWGKIFGEFQIWRLFTFLFIPHGRGWLIFIIFLVIIMWLINDGLEEAWGEFRLNLFLVTSWIGLLIACWLLSSGTVVPPQPWLHYGRESLVLFSVLFGAFACLYPNYEILLFFILPVKVKWLALVDAAYLLSICIQGQMSWLLLLLGATPFFVVFVPRLIFELSTRSKAASRRNRFLSQQASPDSSAFHTCANCGVTDTENPDLDFRIGEDEEEYCSSCLEKMND